ncbi:hypothetical protein EB796_021671 [Bugula neritina]|uniref:Uncharacterized protein n=1 Tax=Bugula neritina TaxID=10212 RepID=A0A7J7J2X2_BUGNE|nr:hypothetical protein EB796_021671 [Bugula neritina]
MYGNLWIAQAALIVERGDCEASINEGRCTNHRLNVLFTKHLDQRVEEATPFREADATYNSIVTSFK